MARRNNDKINCPSNLTNPAQFAVLLDAIQQKGSVTNDEARDIVFPQARAAVSRYNPSNPDTHGLGHLALYGLVDRTLDADTEKYHVSFLGRRLLECYNKSPQTGKFVLKEGCDYTYNDVLIDCLLFWSDNSGQKVIHPGYLLLNLLLEERLDCYLTDSDWAFICQESDYRDSTDYEKLVAELLSFRSSGQSIDKANAYAFLVAFSGNWKLFNNAPEGGQPHFTLKEITKENLRSKKIEFSLMNQDVPCVEDDSDAEEESCTSHISCLDINRGPRTSELHPLNFIIYGAPGTGKTYSTVEYALAIIENRAVDKSRKSDEERKAIMSKYKAYIRDGQIVFTTFHQSYGYEEFIQGLRPNPNKEGPTFIPVDGVFKRIADNALVNPDKNYVIIIDEINRANISKVFGELITLIETDKRWGEINEACATLQSGDVFAVPNNLYIIGTMNSADKSISLIDAALRRRFEFVEQYPDESLIDDATLKTVFNKLNSILSDSLESSDLLIGHSYFMGKSEDALCSILNNRIIPLLYEYFYDNRKKVLRVLKESLDGLSVQPDDSNKISRIRVK